MGVMATVCSCHQVPRVFKGGHLRCPVKWKALVERHIRSRDLSQVNARRVRVAGRRIYMPTVELAEKARQLKAEAYESFARQQGRA